jgi:hypothetical protein
VVSQDSADSTAIRGAARWLRSGAVIVLFVAACAPTASGPVASTPGSVPTASASGANGGWTALRWRSPGYLPGTGQAHDLDEWNGGFVAVGDVDAEGDAISAAAWFAADGSEWTQTLLDDPSGQSTIRYLVPLGKRLLAIGTSGVLRCVPPEGEGQKCDPLAIATWLTTDGMSWQNLPFADAFGGAFVVAVASDGATVTVVGNRGWDDPAIWQTTDGIAWIEKQLPGAIFSGAHFVGVARASGRWIIVGFRGGAEPVCCEGNKPDHVPAAWWSRDGATWQAADVVDAEKDLGWSLGQLFVGSGAILTEVGPGLNRWISTDGETWSRTVDDGGVQSLAASDGQRTVGYTVNVARQFRFALSTDGLSWRQLENAGSVEAAPSASDERREWLNVVRLFPSSLGLLGENAAHEYPIWIASGIE